MDLFSKSPDIHNGVSGHIETVCLLSKGDVKSQKLRVEFSLEDMDTDGFKKGATYNAIRDWIKEKYGYRVTNLNIAQVKQKHGIIERENYNKPKSPDSKQPGYQNNPKFKKFIADNGLGFKPYARFGKAEITERIQLLVQLFNLVWNTEMFS